jgi:hypothetical protein
MVSVLNVEEYLQGGNNRLDKVRVDEGTKLKAHNPG